MSARWPGWAVCWPGRDVGHLPPRPASGFPGWVFVSEERVLTVSFRAAAERLASLPRSGWPGTLSRAVYRVGVEYLMRVGPAGAVPGTSRLVRVRFTEPSSHDGTMSVGLRWEAVGVTGKLFPALDADIRLTDDDDGTRVTLTGSYRPPFGALGVELDRLMLRTVATATIRALLTRLTAYLENAPAAAVSPSVLWSAEPESAAG